MKTVRLTPEEFDACAADTGVSESILALVRRVLVDGETSQAVADASGVSRQRVSTLKKRILEAFALRGGWVEGSVCLPLGMHAELNRYGDVLREHGRLDAINELRGTIRRVTDQLNKDDDNGNST